MVDVEKEGAEKDVELRQGEGRLSAYGPALGCVPVQLTQEHFVQRPEDAFDATAAPRPTRKREDEPNPEVRSDLLQMMRREVAPVVDIEDVREPAHAPARVALAPDSLAQGQRCVQGGGVLEGEEVPGHRATEVVEDNGQPGLGNLSIRAHEQDVERCVVRQPECVRRGRLRRWTSSKVLQ